MFFSTLQYHCRKVGRVLTKDKFITSCGSVVISDHCFGFVRGWVGWYNVGVVLVGVLLDGDCLRWISLSKENSVSILLIEKRVNGLSFQGFQHQSVPYTISSIIKCWYT